MPNQSLQQTVTPVTSLAGASAAPGEPAAEAGVMVKPRLRVCVVKGGKMSQFIAKTWAVSVAVLLILVAGARAEGAEASFSITPPASGWLFTLEFDLGVTVAEVTAISVTAEGTALTGSYGKECPGLPTISCDDPVVILRRFSIVVSDDEYLGSPSTGASWLREWDGPFSVAETIDVGGTGFLADGKGLIRYMDDGAFSDHMFLLACAQQGCSSTGCARGQMLFNTPIVVTISYNPAVPITDECWGAVKAVYR